MYKSHKICLDPNNVQRTWFAQQCGYARFAYNHALAEFKRDTSKSTFDLNKWFNFAKKEHAWTKDMDQRASTNSVKNLGDAVKRWRSGIAGFPKFKVRGHRDSWTTHEASVKIDGNRIRLPKIGWIRMRQELRFVGEIIKVTISRRAHKWFASITVKVADTEVVDNSTLPAVGVDVGINPLATLDDGTKFDNPRPLRRYERKLAREQRKLSRKEYQSNNWYRQKLRVERIHYRIACIREDAHHKATTAIVSRASKICVETLCVKNLLRNRNIAKALSDSALGGFLAKLKTKAESRNVAVVEADTFFASSKICSNCGCKKENLTLSDREYKCDCCGFTADRDVNAAINLRNLTVSSTESLNACGADVRPAHEADGDEAGIKQKTYNVTQLTLDFC